MSKKVNKGFGTYLLIFLGMLLASFLVMVVVMIFNPGMEIFGISYFNENSRMVVQNVELHTKNGAVLDADGNIQTAKIYSADSNGVQTVLPYNLIEINSNIHDVLFFIRSETDPEAYDKAPNIVVETKNSGFVKDGTRSLIITPKYFQDDKILQINVEAPNGFANFGNNSKIYVELPKDTSIAYNIKASTQQGSISLGREKSGTAALKAKSIDLKTTSGDIFTTSNFELVGVYANNSLETTTGDINFSKPIIGNSLNIITKSGEVRLENATINLTNEFNYSADDGFLHVKDINAPNINFNSISGKIYAENLNGNVDFTTVTENCNFQATSVKGSLIIGKLNEDELKTKTNVNITEYVYGKCDIYTLGSINIGGIKSPTVIRSKDAPVTIANVDSSLVLNTVSSKVVLGKVQDENGNVVEHGIFQSVDIICSGNADLELYFERVALLCEILNEKGKIYADLSLSSNKDYNLNATADKIQLNGENAESPLNINPSNILYKLTLKGKEINIKTFA